MMYWNCAMLGPAIANAVLSFRTETSVTQKLCSHGGVWHRNSAVEEGYASAETSWLLPHAKRHLFFPESVPQTRVCRTKRETCS
eukprot:983425-Rhodomonas_salina.2